MSELDLQGFLRLDGSSPARADVLRLFTEPETDDDRKRQLARALFADR